MQEVGADASTTALVNYKGKIGLTYDTYPLAGLQNFTPKMELRKFKTHATTVKLPSTFKPAGLLIFNRSSIAFDVENITGSTTSSPPGGGGDIRGQVDLSFVVPVPKSALTVIRKDGIFVNLTAQYTFTSGHHFDDSQGWKFDVNWSQYLDGVILLASRKIFQNPKILMLFMTVYGTVKPKLPTWSIIPKLQTHWFYNTNHSDYATFACSLEVIVHEMGSRTLLGEVPTSLSYESNDHAHIEKLLKEAMDDQSS